MDLSEQTWGLLQLGLSETSRRDFACNVSSKLPFCHPEERPSRRGIPIATKELAQRYSDRKPDLADLCLIRMSELHPKHYIVTVDESDFRAFRRNKRESIPLLCPPRK